MIPLHQLEKILARFPKFKLSYEKITHKKVYSDLCITIPFGKKFFAWFTYYQNKDVCILMEIASKQTQQISSIQVVPVCFDRSLSLGTIFYGTIVHIQQQKVKFFNVEDVHYYKGKHVSSQFMINKLKLFDKIFSHQIKQVAYHDAPLVFALPVMSTNYDSVVKQAKSLPYNLYAIQFRCMTKHQAYLNLRHNNEKHPQQKTLTNNPVLFTVRANLQNDIYDLYCINDETSKLTKHSIAFINNYKKSVWFNKLFRTIRENDNLDALEESESEDDFEDIRPDKYVDLTKEFVMKCVYHTKFKKWEPVEIVKDGKPSSLNVIAQIQQE